MKIQKKANHLLLGTHGRSIYRADLAPIQQVNTGANAQIFDIASVRSSGRWGNSWSSWSEPNEPNVAINYYTSNAGKFSMVIKDEEGKEVQRVALLPSAGLNVFNYDLSITDKGKKLIEKANSSLDIQKAKSGKYYLPNGVYTVSLDGGGGNSNAAQTTLEIK